MDRSDSGDLIHQAVVPGSSSGVYYIPVSNLDPSMTFSDLRAVAREAASVEKSFIYPNSREGWVRVRGYSHFEKVYKHLNGYKYNGTTLSASGNNENDRVYILDVRKSPHGIESTCSYIPASGVAGDRGDSSVPRYTDDHPPFEGGPGFDGGIGDSSGDHTGGAGSGSYYPVAASGGSPSMEYGGTYYSGYGHQATPSTAAFDATYSRSHGSSSAASSGYPGQALSPSYLAEGSPVSMLSYAGDGGDEAAPWYMPYPEEGPGDAAAGYYEGQQQYYNNCEPGNALSSSPLAEHMAAAAAMAPQPETLKIIVKNLSRHAKHDNLEDFLVKAAGGKHKLQENVRIPRSSSSSSSSSSSRRRHAFLLFKNHSDAVAALDRLNKSRFEGLAIEARFATETVLPLASDYNNNDVYGYSHGGHTGSGNATPTPGTVDDRTHSPALTATSSSAVSDGVQSHNLVVDGTSAYGRAKKAEAAKGNRKHRK